jgi:CTD kinase subunit gamma
MADPFEVRMRFTTLLSHLSASTTASVKTAHYALKHRDMDEDLHSCILENLERPNLHNSATNGTTNNEKSGGGNTHSLNNRANIMYFLEHHADINLREGGHSPYVEMVKRDISRIVESVAQSGANVKVCRRVVSALGEKGVLERDVLGRIEGSLKEREEKFGKLLSDHAGENAQDDGQMDDVVPDATTANVEGSAKPTPKTSSSQNERKPSTVSKVDKRAIEQRIEEDRERNKRLRESVWAVSGDDEQEMTKMWEDLGDAVLGEDERIVAAEEAEERKQFVRYHLMQVPA